MRQKKQISEEEYQKRMKGEEEEQVEEAVDDYEDLKNAFYLLESDKQLLQGHVQDLLKENTNHLLEI